MNQWVVLNRYLFIYKAAGASLALLCLVLGILCIILASRNPIVAVAAENDYLYFQGRRSAINLNEANIKRFVEQYIKASYEWESLNPDAITKNIAPFVTDAFRENSFAFLRERGEKQFAGKKISQTVSGLLVDVTKDSTIAVFDIVLRVEGIPLIVPTQVALQLVKGPQNQWNPMGLYINGATTHEGK